MQQDGNHNCITKEQHPFLKESKESYNASLEEHQTKLCVFKYKFIVSSKWSINRCKLKEVFNPKSAEKDLKILQSDYQV